MPERRNVIPAWAWIVGAVLLIASVFVGYRIVQTQQHLTAAQRELEIAKRAAETANDQRKQFEIKSNAATSAVRSAEIQLAKAQSVLEAAQRELENTTQATKEANAQRAETQTKFDQASSENKSLLAQLAEKQSLLETLQ